MRASDARELDLFLCLFMCECRKTAFHAGEILHTILPSAARCGAPAATIRDTQNALQAFNERFEFIAFD